MQFLSRFQLLVLFLLSGFASFGQIQICRSYGGPDDEQGYALVEAPGGGYVMAGQTKSFGTGGVDVYVVKVDAQGDIVWTRTVGGSGDDYAFSMVATSDGGYMLGGNTSSYGAGSDDFYFIKLDANGTVQWTKSVGGTGSDRGWEVVQTTDGGYAMAGQTTSFGAAPMDIYVVKLDASGNLLWDKRYGNSPSDIAYSLTATSDGGLAVCGSSYYFIMGNLPASTNEYYILKLDSNGGLEWTRFIRDPNAPNTYPDYARSIIQTSDGGYMVSGEAGRKKNSGGYVPKIFLVKLDGSGNVSWTRYYGATAIPGVSAENSDYGECVIQTSDGGYVIAGYTFSFNYNFQLAQDVGLELYIIKVDANGNLLWTKVIGGPDNEIGRAIISTSDGGFAVAGTHQPRVAGSGSEDFYLMKMDAALENCCTMRSGGEDLGTAASNLAQGSTFTAGGISSVGGISDSGGSMNNFCSLVNLEVSITPNHVKCKGNCTGSATAQVIGGSPPYTYTWTSGSTEALANALCAGTYSVFVEDNDGNKDTATVTILEPALALSATIQGTDLQCHGRCDGSAEVVVEGGTPGYRYEWDTNPFQTSPRASALCAGTYTCTITDTANCVFEINISLAEPDEIQLQSSTSPADCGTPNGSATATVLSGGTPPYAYSWNTNPVQTSSTATNLQSGNYTCTVTDSKGCEKIVAVTVSSTSGATVSAVSGHVNCPGENTGSIELSLSGGTAPFIFSWNTNPPQNTAIADSLAPGIYTCQITDANNCIIHFTDTITGPDAFVSTISHSPMCGANSGQASISLSGGTAPYSFSWSPGAQTGANVSGLSAGEYTVNFADARGCTGSDTVLIQTLDIPLVSAGDDQEINIGESVELSGMGDQGTWYWEPDTKLSCNDCQNPVASPLQSTQYVVHLTAANGCSATDTVWVKVNIECGEVFVPNAFSPNNDGENEQLCVYGNCFKSLRFMVFDRWGEKVFDSTDTHACWDGSFKGKPLNNAVFGYYLEGLLFTGEEIKQKGEINLIR